MFQWVSMAKNGKLEAKAKQEIKKKKKKVKY